MYKLKMNINGVGIKWLKDFEISSLKVSQEWHESKSEAETFEHYNEAKAVKMFLELHTDDEITIHTELV
jgi:hypothetical protein